jgi:hypothetical protein
MRLRQSRRLWAHFDSGNCRSATLATVMSDKKPTIGPQTRDSKTDFFRSRAKPNQANPPGAIAGLAHLSGATAPKLPSRRG